MKVSLKIKLLFYWQKIFKRHGNSGPLIKISKDGKGVKSVLFILPSKKREAQLAAHFIKNDDKKNKYHFNYLLHEDSLSYYSENIIPNSHIIKKDDLNWFGAIISKSKLNNINKLSFDAIVDLNQSHNQSLSFILSDLNIPIKVGFQAEFSNFLYNITLESKSIGFLEEKYLMIENILGLE